MPTFFSALLLCTLAFGFGLTSPESAAPAIIVLVLYGSFIKNHEKPTKRRLTALASLEVIVVITTKYLILNAMPPLAPVMHGIVVGLFLAPTTLVFIDAMHDLVRKPA